MADSEHTPTRVFVSYSHSDRPWLARLQVHLKPLVRDGSVDLWDDMRIGAGADWKGEIDQALAAAQVAVLLVSPDFLASDFVQDHEIPPLLEAASQRGCRILPVIVSHSLYGESVLGRFQAVNDPAAPLKELAEVEQDRVLRDLAQEIAAGVGGAAARAQETQRSPARLPTSGAAGASALRPPHLGWALTGLPLAACLVAVWWWVGPSRAP
ncbi:MAG: toll/interleukin-1 receptor domain-containing protein, partial [Pseudomonadota bacterium]